MPGWNFFTNHGHVLFVLALNPDSTIRQIALEVGITERATQKIIHHLVEDKFVKVTKIGRQNHYNVVMSKHLKHKIEKNCQVGELVSVVSKSNFN